MSLFLVADRLGQEIIAGGKLWADCWTAQLGAQARDIQALSKSLYRTEFKESKR